MSSLSDLKGLGYNAVSIEHSMAILFGESIGARGLNHDADVFRGGNVADLAKVVTRIADTLEQRVANLEFADTDNGSPIKRIRAAITGLRSVAAAMSNSADREPQDYHWLIISELVLTISALLENSNA